jgi:hypothetical protein
MSYPDVVEQLGCAGFLGRMVVAHAVRDLRPKLVV